jgi:hypothetical protein
MPLNSSRAAPHLAADVRAERDFVSYNTGQGLADETDKD